MAIKCKAKEIMEKAGVPVVKGYHGAEQSDERLFTEAQKIGFPIMLKAVYGGGGKGMRIAQNETEFHQALESARRESKKAFGNDDMLIEKFVDRPRHVEVQVFGDRHANYVSLHERDCSIQRRHQKIVEEAPAPGISAETRRFLGESAVRAARAVDYVGAGTVEFIMDARQRFYFMEMNTRLQVEHPVTELITGFDLVEWQLLVAAGHPLPVTENEHIPLKGHALECRVYAEDPGRDEFMPCPGKLTYLSYPPHDAKTLRVETGVRQGDTVSVHYDPMIAKLVTWSPSGRSQAIDAMRLALCQTSAVGVKTNVQFLDRVLAHDDFVAGDVYTDFIPDRKNYFFEPETELHTVDSLAPAVAALLIKRHLERSQNCADPFYSLPYFRVNMDHTEKMYWIINGENLSLDVTHKSGEKSIHVSHNNQTASIGYDLIQAKALGDNDCLELTFSVDSSATGGPVKTHKAVWHSANGEDGNGGDDGNDVLTLLPTDISTLPLTVTMAPAAWRQELRQGGASGDAMAHGPVAPMPGVIEKVMVNVGDTVERGDRLVVMVAMKMEYVIKSGTSGRVVQVQCVAGDNVQKGHRLIEIE